MKQAMIVVRGRVMVDDSVSYKKVINKGNLLNIT